MERTFRELGAGMVPLYAARIEDLGPRDFVRVECACGHDEMIAAAGLTHGMRLPPTRKYSTCNRGCGAAKCESRGSVSLSIKWAGGKRLEELEDRNRGGDERGQHEHMTGPCGDHLEPARLPYPRTHSVLLCGRGKLSREGKEIVNVPLWSDAASQSWRPGARIPEPMQGSCSVEACRSPPRPPCREGGRLPYGTNLRGERAYNIYIKFCLSTLLTSTLGSSQHQTRGESHSETAEANDDGNGDRGEHPDSVAVRILREVNGHCTAISPILPRVSRVSGGALCEFCKVSLCELAGPPLASNV